MDVFRLPWEVEAAFRRQFTASKRVADLFFLSIQCMVTMSYARIVPPAQLLLRLATNVLPLWLWLDTVRHARLRTPLVLAIKLVMIFFLCASFTNDFYSAAEAPRQQQEQQQPQPQPQGAPWPLFAFKLAHTSRVLGPFAAGVGLQLPLALDAPLGLLGAAAIAATAVPRQCLSGRAPPGARTLFQLNRGKFQAMADWLDLPFSTIVRPHRGDLLALPDEALCVAVYTWVQLVVALGAPLIFLLVSERLQRRRFLRATQASWARSGGGEEAGSGGLPMVWHYFLCGALICWCLIRTAAKLALP